MHIKGDISLFAKDMGKVRLNPPYLDALIPDQWLIVANKLIEIKHEHNVPPERMRLYIKLAAQVETDLLTAVELMAKGLLEVTVEVEGDSTPPANHNRIGA